jgi:glycosyltransferase involved in cell wall biosynthesis
METLEIAQISTAVYPLPPENYAGIEAIVNDLSHELARLGHEVTVFAPRGTATPLGDKHYNVFETVPPSNMYKDDISYKCTSQYDIIHDHSHLKYVYTHPNAKRLNICSTLHNQVNFTTPLNQYDFNEYKSNRLLFLSRISRFKGAHEAITLAKQLHMPLDVAGEDVFVNDPPYVHSIMSSCTGDVVYHGTVPDAIKKSLLSRARALILPLLWDEPFGLVAIEALASGTPVIALRRGAMPEILIDGKTGFLCNTIQEMKDAIEKIDDIKPSDCRVNAERFTIEKMTENYVSMYRDILDGKEW